MFSVLILLFSVAFLTPSVRASSGDPVSVASFCARNENDEICDTIKQMARISHYADRMRNATQCLENHLHTYENALVKLIATPVATKVNRVRRATTAIGWIAHIAHKAGTFLYAYDVEEE